MPSIVRTGEPLWPMLRASPCQDHKCRERSSHRLSRFHTKPEPFELQGISLDDLVDFTPELRQLAIEAVSEFEIGPLFNPPLHYDNALGKTAALWCPGGRVVAPTSMDRPLPIQSLGILYVTSSTGCTARVLGPGAEADLRCERSDREHLCRLCGCTFRLPQAAFRVFL